MPIVLEFNSLIIPRCWVWRAFSQRQAGDLLDALTTYEKALEILEWGSIHVHEQARGEVFHPSFVRAVQHAYVNTLRKVCGQIYPPTRCLTPNLLAVLGQRSQSRRLLAE